MVKNTDFIGSLYSDPYKFQHYDISDFSLFVNGKQFPNEGLFLGMDHEKTSVMATGRFSKPPEISLEFRTADNTRYVYKRLFHVTI